MDIKLKYVVTSNYYYSSHFNHSDLSASVVLYKGNNHFDYSDAIAITLFTGVLCEECYNLN